MDIRIPGLWHRLVKIFLVYKSLNGYKEYGLNLFFTPKLKIFPARRHTKFPKSFEVIQSLKTEHK